MSIQINLKKSVTVDNDEHDPLTLNSLHEFLKECDSLQIPGDTVIEFEASAFGGGIVIEAVSATENTRGSK